MKPRFTVICVPLDERSSAESPGAFNVAIVCEPRFPAAEYSPQEMSGILDQHPIIRGGQAIKAYAKPFDAWRANPSMQGSGVVELTLTHSQDEHGSLEQRASALRAYMGVPRAVRSGGIVHDQRFDQLAASHFVDVAKIYDDLMEFKRFVERLGNKKKSRGATLQNFAPHEIDGLELGQFRRSDAVTQAAILDVLGSPKKSAHVNAMMTASGSGLQIQAIRSGLEKIAARLTVSSPAAAAAAPAAPSVPGQLVGAASMTARPVSMQDPNVAVHAGLRNALVASACGFVTHWVAKSPMELTGDWVIEVDLSSAKINAALVELSSKQTAFRRREQTHPLAYSDLGAADTGNGAYAALNTLDGDPRYRASSINTESQLVKDFIVQPKNSLSDIREDSHSFGAFTKSLDTRRPQLLRDQQLGTSEPETSGIVFSAPAEDLVTPAALKPTADGERTTPGVTCNFLEDLWIGFRLDLASRPDGPFSSVHRQRQKAVFRQGGYVEGDYEDFFDREQADDEARQFSSTEFGAYNGLSTAQAHDMRVLLDLEKLPQAEGPFTTTTLDYTGATRLEFGNLYRYRLRNVFLGCISLQPNARGAVTSRYVQTVPFFRARGYRAGEVVAASGGATSGNAKDRLTFNLTEAAPTARFTLAPTPIDIEACRYHGLLLANADESRAHSERRFVKDASKMFSASGTDMHYFYDPDVAGVVIRAKVLNGPPRKAGQATAYEGKYCEVVPHLQLTSVKQSYGTKGEWEDFKPIVITLRTTELDHPVLRRPGLLFNCHQVEVLVPPACEIELSIVPDVDVGEIQRTAHFVSSSGQLINSSRSSDYDRDWNPFPAVTEQVIRVTHALPRPRREPRIVQSQQATRDGVRTAIRERNALVAEVAGHIELDAPSTGQVRLNAQWTDIDDRPEYEVFALQTGHATTKPHSVIFSEMQGPAPRGIDTVGQGYEDESVTSPFAHCAENKVFLGGAESPSSAAVPDRWHALDFKDDRRKLASVTAVARTRFESIFGTRAVDLQSDPALVDVPSTARLKAPRVSHILPLGKSVQGTERGVRRQRTTYAFRVYVQRPWFQSGPGERLAIGCLVGPEPNKVQESLDKSFSQWGEDPLERPGLVSSRRVPRAADFESPSDATLDVNLYPTRSDRRALLRRDNVATGEDDKKSKRLSIASYAVVQDPASRLWYCDVAIGPEFFGWCGLALYRHQPSACEGRELSEEADWAYAAVIHGDPVTWIERNGQLHATVGPVYDLYVSFELDATEYRDGVSENLQVAATEVVEMRRYNIGRAYYFEAAGSARTRSWSLVKRRFGHGIASVPLSLE